MATTWQYFTIKRTTQGNFTTTSTDDPTLQIALNQVGVTEHNALELAGEQGWELVTVVPGTQDTTFYYMKRESDQATGTLTNVRLIE